MTPQPADAAARITANLLAAAWRENLDGIRDRAHISTQPPTPPAHHPRDTSTATIGIDTPDGLLSLTAETGPYRQITPTGPIQHNGHTINDPETLLRLLSPHAPEQLTKELRDAVTGLTTALPRHRQLTQNINTTANTHHSDTAISLATTLRDTHPSFVPCRFFEPLAVDGHHLHPCARTRLGWNEPDRNAYDLETTTPIGIRFVAARRDTITSTPDIHGRELDELLENLHPPLREHRDPNTRIVPLHPWQHHHLHHGPARELFDTGALTDLPVTPLNTAPTASIRTLVTPDGSYLKCSLSIHITSTQRGISPPTVHNGPILSALLSDIITHDDYLTPRIDILTEHAGTSLPHGHPAARDLSCLLRARLTDVTTTDELAIPATALPATSPVTGTSIAAELIAACGLDPTDFLHRYTAILAGTTIRLASHYGIGTEAHLQNCVPTFINGTPHRVIIRDLGGGRVLLPQLKATGHHPDLHPASIITTTDPDTVRAKVAYTVFQNHLAAITTALAHDRQLPQDQAWRVIADTIATIDMPPNDRAYYTAATVPHKALLTMRLHPGAGDIHIPVPNTLATP